jgi:predicted RNA-binding Zn-ribbon protein involved in translation (DUF1610 family)
LMKIFLGRNNGSLRSDQVEAVLAHHQDVLPGTGKGKIVVREGTARTIRSEPALELKELRDVPANRRAPRSIVQNQVRPQKQVPAWKKKSQVFTTYTGGTARYFPWCWGCGERKGNSNAKYCPPCSRMHPVAQHVKFTCPSCSHEIHRDEVIKGLYFAGASANLIGAVFNIGEDRVRVIAYRGRK